MTTALARKIGVLLEKKNHSNLSSSYKVVIAHQWESSLMSLYVEGET